MMHQDKGCDDSAPTQRVVAEYKHVWEGYRVYYKGEEEDRVNELEEVEGSVFEKGRI